MAAASTTSVLEKVLLEVRSGLVSSVAAEAALFPLDTVKLRQQVHGGAALEVLRTLLKEQGVRGLYQGLLGRLIQTITSNVGFFIWQTLFVQMALRRVAERAGSAAKLSTTASLVVNMLAQQLNRILTTPVDVVANVNQADPYSKGFFHTFAKLARTGGRATLWRGLSVSLLLSLNPAMMFTLVGKLTTVMAKFRGVPGSTLSAGDMFWISGISKAVATIVTYPLIRAKAVMQTGGAAPSSLFKMLANIATDEGIVGLYSGVWIMSYKTVLFNSLMMALKQKFAKVFRNRQSPLLLRRRSWSSAPDYREKLVVLRHGSGKSKKDVGKRDRPWDVAAAGDAVVYVDGSWSFLHAAQDHIIREASCRGKHLVVGVHSDTCLREATGQYPQECYAQRIARLREHPMITSILEEAPWEVTEDLINDLGVSLVVSGTVTKTEDTRLRTSSSESDTSRAEENPQSDQIVDPYKDCRRLGILESVQSLNDKTEHDEQLNKVARVLFSNVDASIDWRILVADGAKTVFGQNPGYSSTR